ncbi:hypothetical protein RDI58_024166 [Solanum bulbocastanum]|jgi:hypothetical protein
MYEK